MEVEEILKITSNRIDKRLFPQKGESKEGEGRGKGAPLSIFIQTTTTQYRATCDTDFASFDLPVERAVEGTRLGGMKEYR